MRTISGSIAGIVAVVIACDALADTISIGRSQFVVGEGVAVSYDVASSLDSGSARLELYERGSGVRIWSEALGSEPRGIRHFEAPADPARFELRLLDAADRVVEVAGFETIVTPTPGALALDGQVFDAGSTIRVAVALQKGRYYGNPWVGLFEVGRTTGGGASIGDRRVNYQHIGDQTELLFAAPDMPGRFAFRLFDRDADRYILDVVEFEIVVKPTPGSIELAKSTFAAGETIEVAVDVPADRFYGNPWVGLFSPDRPADGGAAIDRSRIGYQHFDPSVGPSTLSFTAPEEPGRYEFRLYDRNDWRYLLDIKPFTVEVPDLPDALSLSKPTFAAGEAIDVGVAVPSGRYYGNPWVGLFATDRAVEGGASVDRSRHGYQHFDPSSGRTTLSFTAPDQPGSYEFRLYDRNDWRFLLDTIAFAVEVPDLPDALQLTKSRFAVGENIEVTVSVPAGRYYGNPWVGLFSADRQVAGGAGVDRSRFGYQHFDASSGSATLSFAAPEDPGDYEFRLYDRNDWRFVLDRLGFSVDAFPQPRLLAIQKRTFRPGELMRIRVRLPEGREASGGWVGIFMPGASVPGGALVGERRIWAGQIDARTRRLALEAPTDPGPYVVRLFDRNGDSFVIAAAEFRVVDPTRSATLLNPAHFTPLPGGGAEPVAPTPTPSEANGLPVDIVVDGNRPPVAPSQPSDIDMSPAPATPANADVEPPPVDAAADDEAVSVDGTPDLVPVVGGPIDPWIEPFDIVEDALAELDAELLDEQSQLSQLAGQTLALDRLLEEMPSGESAIFLSADALQTELARLDRLILAAPEEDLAELVARRDVLRMLEATSGEGGVARAAVEELREGLFDDFSRRIGPYRFRQADRDAMLGALGQRRAALRDASEDELVARHDELEAALADPAAHSLTEADLPRLDRERQDIAEALAARAAAAADEAAGEADAAAVVDKEILPALTAFRKDLPRAARDEDVGVGYTAFGAESMLDESGEINEGAFVEDSLFAEIYDLPSGLARTRATLEYLDAWREYDGTVAQTLDDSPVLDSPFEAMLFNSEARSDGRIKAAALLGEEASEIIRLINDPIADSAVRDRNGERLSRIVARIFDEGTEITGESQATAARTVNEYVATAIAESAGSVLAAQDVIRSLASGEEASPSLVELARANDNTPGRQAELNAMQAAEDLGYLLGVIEAGQGRAIEDQVSRTKAQEETVKAFLDVVFGAATAPLPGVAGKILPTIGHKEEANPFGTMVDNLQSTALGKGKDYVQTGGSTADRARLEDAFRSNTRSYRTLAENLIGVRRGQNVDLNQIVQDTRDRVAQDMLHRQGP